MDVTKDIFCCLVSLDFSDISLLKNRSKITEKYWGNKNEDYPRKNWSSLILWNCEHETHKILSTIFSRLFVLRNQIFHGGSTYNGQLNRQQVEDGGALLSYLIPIILTVMMENPNEDWGDIAYPPAL